ncbi:MAG: hypothetical protein JSU70_22435 [Phycisphaerales bacterium]|nr:MAG: hypothetical protein JSU70_22435 [Phycisphaerales bacterium]
MPTSRPNEDRFDDMLRLSMQGHREPVPAGFTARVLREVERSEEQRILAHVVWQERLALAGCIVVGATVFVGTLLFPGRVVGLFRRVAAGFADQGGPLLDRIPQAVGAVGGDWQLYAILAVALGFALYSLVELLLGDRLRIA